ncbi:hypothetical protein [Ralstonia pseudosolanacearum]|uniref:hypothetical protein n=1 Tax=Ralstonia pseudosolanacearum TaxID=1310165 RepID=UPI001FF70F0C|nr:hypothetical protein [Ralstonia pseudosolanacearum]
MTLTASDFPTELNASTKVHLGQGLTGILTMVKNDGDAPLYQLKLSNGKVLCVGTVAQVMAHVAHYLAHGTIGPAPRYELEERTTPTPFGDETEMVWVLVDG